MVDLMSVTQFSRILHNDKLGFLHDNWYISSPSIAQSEDITEGKNKL
jgi:hypothetical protein